jgi:NADH:ubiquinone oxidoreductase subunit 2 (subunit N)
LDKKSQGNAEAVGKYFFLGAIASGIMLYGISLVYRETNSLSYKNLNSFDFINHFNNDNSNFVLMTGFIFIIFGFFFKLSLTPLQN